MKLISYFIRLSIPNKKQLKKYDIRISREPNTVTDGT